MEVCLSWPTFNSSNMLYWYVIIIVYNYAPRSIETVNRDLASIPVSLSANIGIMNIDKRPFSDRVTIANIPVYLYRCVGGPPFCGIMRCSRHDDTAALTNAWKAVKNKTGSSRRSTELTLVPVVRPRVRVPSFQT